MTRAEYNEILQLHNIGISYKKACERLNISYKTFNNVKYSPRHKCSDERKIFLWDKEKDNELLQLMSIYNLNFREAFRIFAEKHNFKNKESSWKTIRSHWYSILKHKTNESICESVGKDLTARNVKNASLRFPINEKFIKKTTTQMREFHNIPIFDLTIKCSFNHIYKP